MTGECDASEPDASTVSRASRSIMSPGRKSHRSFESREPPVRSSPRSTHGLIARHPAGGGLALAFAIKIRDAGATPDGRDGAWHLPAPAGCLAISPWVDLGEERIGGSRLSNERWDFLPGDMIDLLARETVEASGFDLCGNQAVD